MGTSSNRAVRSCTTDALCSYRLTPYLHFPFLTSQWKSPNSNQNHSHAHNQAGRDGAVIVNHLHEFYSISRERKHEPNVVETCHFSLTCDLLNGNIFVHWREQNTHHMELVYEFSLRKEAEVESARQILWNIADHAVGERLESLKAAIPAFARNKRHFPPISENTTARSVTSLDSQSWVQFRPSTPTSVVSEPAKKKRKDDNV